MMFTHGSMKVPTGTSNRQSSYSANRFQLRNAWNGSVAKTMATTKLPVTPFRGIFNAGNLPQEACNSKRVFDSSDYVRFKKQGAYSQTYNNTK